jgi:hypothetical protein
VKNFRFRVPSPALIIALCALVFSMAGGAYAAAKINGKNIKKGTVTGKALKKNTLTGTQIRESKLGKVPKATAADTAGTAANAALLAGIDQGAFARNANFVRAFKSMNVGEADVTLVSVGDISVRMSCQVNAANDEMNIYAVTATNGAALESEEDDQDPLDTADTAPNSEISEGALTASAVTSYEDGYDDTGFVISADSTHLITLLEGSASKIMNRSGKDCIFGGTFIVE